MSNIRSVCLIPARGGSKRIPRKNIIDFHGKPMISYSIDAAIKSELFDHVYVSTDDVEIADIAQKLGATIPFIRPKKYSDDFSNDQDVLSHFIDWLYKNNIKPDFLCYLYATAPFCTPSILQQCFDLLVTSDVAQVHTITTFSYPIMRALSKDQKGFLSFIWEDNALKRSQDFDDYYHDAGLCYFFDLNKYGVNNDRLGLLLPRFRCQDIDSYEDLDFASKLFSILQTESLDYS